MTCRSRITYSPSHGLCDKSTHCVWSQALELVFQLLRQSCDVALNRLSTLHFAIWVALRYMMHIFGQDILVDSPASNMVTDGKGAKGISMVGLFT